jgi:hypothetical protein
MHVLLLLLPMVVVVAQDGGRRLAGAGERELRGAGVLQPHGW